MVFDDEFDDEEAIEEKLEEDEIDEREEAFLRGYEEDVENTSKGKEEQEEEI